MRERELWLWVEAVICLGSTVPSALFGLVMTAHWVVTTLRFGPWVSASSFVYSAYALGAGLGVIAAVILLRTQFGGTASPASLLLARLGLACGALVAAVIPDGVLPVQRFNESFALSREALASLLPLACLAHFAYLGRRNLFPDVFGNR